MLRSNAALPAGVKTGSGVLQAGVAVEVRLPSLRDLVLKLVGTTLDVAEGLKRRRAEPFPRQVAWVGRRTGGRPGRRGRWASAPGRARPRRRPAGGEARVSWVTCPPRPAPAWPAPRSIATSLPLMWISRARHAVAPGVLWGAQVMRIWSPALIESRPQPTLKFLIISGVGANSLPHFSTLPSSFFTSK